MNCLRVSMLAMAGLLFALSVVLLGLICHSLAYMNGNASQKIATFIGTYSTFDANGRINGTVTSQRIFAYLPSKVEMGSYWIIFAAGMGGLLDSLLIVFFVVRRSPISIAKVFVFDSFNAAVAVLSLLRIGIDIASIAFSFAQFSNSSDFDFNGATNSDQRYIGHFTLEAFNCHLKDYTTDVDTFNQWCVQGRTARWILIPHLLLSICIFVLSLISMALARHHSKKQNPRTENN